MKLEGNLINRLMENKQCVDEIKVGTGVTVCGYSDRHAYEVVAVIDQQHIRIREYDHKAIGEPMSNNWKLISNKNNPVATLVKRGQNWYFEKVAHISDLESDDFERRLWVYNNDFNVNIIKQKGYATKYKKANVFIGNAEYYYDYEF